MGPLDAGHYFPPHTQLATRSQLHIMISADLNATDKQTTQHSNALKTILKTGLR